MAETDSQPIAENEQVKELLALLKDNNTPGYEEFAKLIEHVTGMEQRLSEATKELKAVRQEMQGLQNHSLKDALQKSCKAMEANISATPKGGYVMEIFAAFAAKPEESGSETSPWQLSWKDDGAYTTWLTAMKERSAVESDVTVTCSDKVLTLSTCTPGGTGRFLVMGKLVKVDNEI